ncbi:MAG: hypothetical protein WC614_12580 [bacterium]
MTKYFLCLALGILFATTNANGSSVRLAGMGNIYVALEDTESEAQANPAKYLNFNQPVVLFDALSGYTEWDNGFFDLEDLDNYELLPVRHYDYERNVNGLILYPIKKKAVLGGGYTENVATGANWRYYEISKELARDAYYTQYIYRSYFFTGAFSTKYINIGVLSRFYTDSRRTEIGMDRRGNEYFSYSYTGDVPVTSEYTIGIASNKIKNISATIDFISTKEEPYSGWGRIRYFAYTSFKVYAKKKIFNWLSIGGITEYKQISESNYKCVNIPLGFAIHPDNQTLIGMDFVFNEIFSDGIQLKHPDQVTIGGERNIGNLALRCGTEIYPQAIKYWFDPSVGIGYHLTNKIHIDLTVDPMDWYPWRLAIQFHN